MRRANVKEWSTGLHICFGPFELLGWGHIISETSVFEALILGESNCISCLICVRTRRGFP